MNQPESTVWRQLSDQTERTDQINISLSVAALVLGIVSVAAAIIVTGAVFGLIGAILGTVALAGKSSGKQMAGWGLGLSIMGILASCFFALAYYSLRVKGIGQYDYEQQETEPLQQFVGTEAPDLALTDLEGNQINLSQLKGNRIMLNFWWPWSLRDRDALPHFIQLRKASPQDQLVIIGLSHTPPEELKAISSQLGLNYPVVSVDELPAPFNQVYSTPLTFFIDKNGIIQTILEEYHDFEKMKTLASAPDYEEYDAQQADELKATPVSDQ